MLDAQCTSCRSSFAYHTISSRVRCMCFPCPSQRPLAASPICQRRPTILEPCTPWSLACACNTLQRSRAPSTVCRGARICCPTPKENPFSQLFLIRQTRALRFRGGCLGAASREERTDGESLRSRGSFATCKPMHRLLLSVHQTTQANLEKRKTESQSQSRSSLQTWMQRQERYPSLERIFVMSFRYALFCFVLCFSLLRFDILAFRALTH